MCRRSADRHGCEIATRRENLRLDAEFRGLLPYSLLEYLDHVLVGRGLCCIRPHFGLEIWLRVRSDCRQHGAAIASGELLRHEGAKSGGVTRHRGRDRKQ